MLWRAKLSQAVVATDIKEGLRVFLFLLPKKGRVGHFSVSKPLQRGISGETLQIRAEKRGMLKFFVKKSFFAQKSTCQELENSLERSQEIGNNNH